MENDKLKLMWDFEQKLRKYDKVRRTDITQQDRVEKRIWLENMACSHEQNIEEKHWEKLNKDQNRLKRE